ncbi:hypothetical protein [Methylovulum psychrotolerans]|jgi:hypothetical protein|nr:hypothetical protein [Methylovulum psychrotolerans]MBT9097944.1 hypothetical protein [Methylovulum psychrotolerans]
MAVTTLNTPQQTYRACLNSECVQITLFLVCITALAMDNNLNQGEAL